MSLSHKLSSRFNLSAPASERDALENKIFNAAALIFFLVSISTAALASFYQSTLWVRLSLSVLSLIFLYVFYNTQYKGKYVVSVKIFALLTLAFNDVAWAWSISSSYTANYFFVFIIVVNLTILKVKDHLAFMVITILNVTLLEYAAFHFPEQILTQPELISKLKFPFSGYFRLMSLIIIVAAVLNYF